jgi:hypothetical protein
MALTCPPFAARLSGNKGIGLWETDPNYRGAPMKNITSVAAFVFLTILLVGTASIGGHADGNMIGRDSTYRGGSNGVSHGGSNGGATCSAAVQRCKRNFPASAASCASAGSSCQQTGTFTNPKGQSFSGLIKN